MSNLPDLKKLREVAWEALSEYEFGGENDRRLFYAMTRPQTILALLDAYEASARYAEYWKDCAHAAEDRISSQPLIDATQGD